MSGNPIVPIPLPYVRNSPKSGTCAMEAMRTFFCKVLETLAALDPAETLQSMSTCGHPTVNVFVACVLMFFGALVGGGIPLFVRISRNRVDVVSSLAAGCLVGSVLGVILPEGFHALPPHEATSHSHDDQEHGGDEHSEHSHGSDWTIGGTILFGFLLMLILDSFSHAHGASHHNYTNQDGENKEVGHLMLGLIIHSVADGLAVGVAGLSQNACIGLLVGIAMVLHKGPVAFGFTTYLITANRPRSQIKRDLLIFASASPIAAVLIYGMHSVVPLLTDPTNVGYCILFSGGTFLYVACSHILPDLLHDSHGTSIIQMCSIIAGAILPLFLSTVVGHGHS